MTKVLLVGDTHGSINDLERACDVAEDLGVDAIYQLGDFGFLFRPNHWAKDFAAAVEVISEYEVPLFWLDGNHENFDAMLELGADPDADEPVQLADLVTYLPRGCRFEIGPATAMAVGGAASIDARQRVEGVSIWSRHEVLSDDQVERACGRGPVDVLLTHDAPYGVEFMESRMRQWGGLPASLVRRSEGNRRRLLQVVDAVHPAAVVHGHHHVPYQDALPGVEVYGLNCNRGHGSLAVLECRDGAVEVRFLRDV